MAFSLENEFRKAVKIDGPITKGPLMRWQRKLNDSSANSSMLNSNNSLVQMNCSLNSLSSKHGKENGSNKSTPSRNSRTPGSSKTPTRAAAIVGDRFIPNRASTNLETAQHLASQGESSTSADCTNKGESQASEKEEYGKVLNGDELKSKVLAFRNKPPSAPEVLSNSNSTPTGHLNMQKVMYSQTKTPICSSKKASRSIPSAPERVLDAPDLQDDYYLNLVSWSSTNILAVALGYRLYIWNASTGDIGMLTEFDEFNMIGSVSWVEDGDILSIGTSSGEVQIWDAAAEKKLRSMDGHECRVGSLAWNTHLLSSGSRNGMIHHHDVRVAQHLVGTLTAHSQEICGLQWSPNGKHLASGANDNIVNVWPDKFSTSVPVPPIHSFEQHQAAVKAIAWCPWQSSLLASGGGTADRCIKFWNVNSGACLNSIDTKSQVCAILWNKEHRELISSHGYPDHHLTIWKYPQMTRVADLMGHTDRVLHMAMSPDGTSVVSGAADETLRLWNCFAVDPAKAKSAVRAKASSTIPLSKGIR